MALKELEGFGSRKALEELQEEALEDGVRGRGGLSFHLHIGTYARVYLQ
jgi:hypothetical protein